MVFFAVILAAGKLDKIAGRIYIVKVLTPGLDGKAGLRGKLACKPLVSPDDAGLRLSLFLPQP